jgi:hypothetical protein
MTGLEALQKRNCVQAGCSDSCRTPSQAVLMSGKRCLSNRRLALKLVKRPLQGGHHGTFVRALDTLVILCDETTISQSKATTRCNP